MRALICLVMVVVGLLLLATPGLPAGLLLIAGAAWVGVPGRAEDRFTTGLMLMGAAGALAMMGRFALERLA
jgi:hypothetical protein